jgi:purine catabolism regulator
MARTSARDLPSLREILRRPAFAGAEVVAGRQGLDAAVRWVHVGEIPDIARYLRGRELILSTGVGLRRPQERRRYLERLADCEVAGVCIELGKYLRRVPDDLVQLADHLALPLIIFSRPVRFVDLTRDAHALILQGEPQQLISLQELAEDLRGIQAGPAAAGEILGRLGLWLRDAAVFRPTMGRMLRYGSPERSAALELSAQAPEPALSPPVALPRLPDGSRVITRQVGGPESGLGLLAVALAHDDDSAAAGVALDLAGAALARVAAQAPGGGAKAEPDDERLVLGLLQGGVPRDVVAQGLERFRQQGRLPVRATVVLFRAAAATSAGLVDELRRRLGRLEVPSLAGPLDGCIAAILFEPIKPAVFERLFDALPPGQGSEASLTGISDHLPLDELPQALREARLALAAQAWSRGRTGPFHQDLGPLRLLAQLRDDCDCERLIEDELGPVLAYDHRHTSELRETLAQLLLCQRKEEAARQLGIRRQTLYYRVERLSSLLGEDFLAPRRRLGLHLALLLHELRATGCLGRGVQSDTRDF